MNIYKKLAPQVPGQRTGDRRRSHYRFDSQLLLAPCRKCHHSRRSEPSPLSSYSTCAPIQSSSTHAVTICGILLWISHRECECISDKLFRKISIRCTGQTRTIVFMTSLQIDRVYLRIFHHPSFHRRSITLVYVTLHWESLRSCHVP